MAITTSAKKALRQSIVRHARNLKEKEDFKSAIKEYKRLVAGKKLEDAKGALAKVFKSLDKAAKNRVIEKNKASRMKSRLSMLLAKTA